MSDSREAVANRSDVASLRNLSVLFLLAALVFYPMVFNSVTFGFFDTETSDAEYLVFVQDNLTALRLIFTGIGLSELALGVALWLWGRHVAGQTAGRRGSVALAFGWVALAAGVVGLAGRLALWFEDAERIVSDDAGFGDVLYVLYSVGFSLSLIVFGVLMIMGAMPTWMGVVWIFFGILYWVGFLPLWFFVPPLVFGIWGIIRFRASAESPPQISAEKVPAA